MARNVDAVEPPDASSTPRARTTAKYARQREAQAGTVRTRTWAHFFPLAGEAGLTVTAIGVPCSNGQPRHPPTREATSGKTSHTSTATKRGRADSGCQPFVQIEGATGRDILTVTRISSLCVAAVAW